MLTIIYENTFLELKRRPSDVIVCRSSYPVRVQHVQQHPGLLAMRTRTVASSQESRI